MKCANCHKTKSPYQFDPKWMGYVKPDFTKRPHYAEPSPFCRECESAKRLEGREIIKEVVKVALEVGITWQEALHEKGRCSCCASRDCNHESDYVGDGNGGSVYKPTNTHFPKQY